MAHAKKQAGLPVASSCVVRLGLTKAQAQNSIGAIKAANVGSTGCADALPSLDAGSVGS